MSIVLIVERAFKPDGSPKPGMYVGRIGSEVIVESRQPFPDGARALLARGYDPDTPYIMKHAKTGTVSFATTTIGHAAGLTTVEDKRGLRFRKFVPGEDPDEDRELCRFLASPSISSASPLSDDPPTDGPLHEARTDDDQETEAS
jgi:hypothetical protein